MVLPGTDWQAKAQWWALTSSNKSNEIRRKLIYIVTYNHEAQIDKNLTNS